MGVFDGAAEQARAKHDGEASTERWRAYAREAHDAFVATELPGLLREYWVAAQAAGTQSMRAESGDSLALVGRYEEPNSDWGSSTYRLWVDARGRIWRDGKWLEPDVFIRQFGCLLRMLQTNLTDAGAIDQAIRAHYEDYLKRQL